MTLSIGWLPEIAYLYLMIFARVGTLLMLVPGFGESFLSTRVRLAFALVVSLMFYPLLASNLPAQPDGIMSAIAVLFHEMAVGLIFGVISRLIISTAQVAGSIIAFQSGLSMAQVADPTQTGVQGAIIGNFLGLLGIALIFSTDLHHLVIAGIFQSYTIYPPTMPLMFEDAYKLAWQVAAQSFIAGVQIASPFLIFGLIFNLGLGILSRMMPQLQIFFIAMPANIGLGLSLFALLLASIAAWYLNHFETQIRLVMGV